MWSSDFVKHTYDYRLNWTPLSPVTITYYYYYYYYYYCYYYYYYYYHKAMCKWPILPIQYCWANNVGSCCICVGIGVQMEATTPNDLETNSTSWELTMIQWRLF